MEIADSVVVSDHLPEPMIIVAMQPPTQLVALKPHLRSGISLRSQPRRNTSVRESFELGYFWVGGES
jgi:hypothetical protein